ncbi:urease accessory protein UreF [Leptolyngbya sp. AN02str]|uniref:urease accessory protein UreF n=1 Tax=Leptolyngbya sp. AN02str TaxID=3423363 RepID=UPI003D31358A
MGINTLPYLLQLASPALPIGAYTYSEGLETLVQQGHMPSAAALQAWITQELTVGAMRLEAVAMCRAYTAAIAHDTAQIIHWNHWLSALRETEELRNQSWQMGRSLARLLTELEPDMKPLLEACSPQWNVAIVMAIAAAHWQIDLEATVTAYLHSWISNLINSGVKLIPLGQTAGQRLLVQLYQPLKHLVQTILTLSDEELYACNWGWAIASMNHETLYTRLFRS